VRTLETNLLAPLPAGCAPGTAPQPGLDYPTSVRAFGDLMVLAFQCDLTQVISYMIEFDISYRSHPFLNADLGHHALTHTGTADAVAALVRVETWQAEQLAYVATRLQTLPDVDGRSMLDNSLLMGISSMAQGAIHEHANLSAVLVGGAGGLKMGQHIAYNNGQSVANLMLTVQQALGGGAKSFGNSTGLLPGAV
jgi:hypothetical protein